MDFDLDRIFASKREYRRELAARPIGEKLRMLDAMRERALTLRRAMALRETTEAYPREPERPE